MPRTLKLSKKLTTHKGEITELELRDLTAADMIEMRVAPFSFINLGDNTKADISNKRVDQRVETRYDIVFGYLRLLTGVSEIELKPMAGRDLATAAGVIGAMWNEESGESEVAS